MAQRALLLGILFAASCYKDGGSGGGTTPPPANNNPAAVRGVDYSATIADPLGFLPVDSEIVLGLDVDQLRKSTFWPPIAAKLSSAGGSGLDTFKQVCNVDPMTSVRSVTLGVKNVKQSTPDGVMVVSGLDRVALMACMEKATKTADSRTSIQNGIVVIAGAKSTGGTGLGATAAGDGTVAFAFVDASTLVGVIGPTASRTQLQTVLAAGTPLRSSPAFSALIKLTNLEASLWTMMNGNSSVFDQAAGMLGSRPKAAFGSVNVTAGMSLDMRLRLDDAGRATQLQQMINGQVGMARAMFTKLDVTTDGADLVVSASMTDAQITQVLQLAGVSLNGP
ncbi:MAG: hypothetical protein H0T46_28600 [Deltaproteobacteria bacterium]|nr:hypothetical protein [Deltaproteobacteria bacterium]